MAADLYDLERLRVACEKKLSERVQDVPTAMSMLALVNGRQLEDLCVGCIASDPEAWKRAMATEEYRELKRSAPSALNDILEKVATRLLQQQGQGPSLSPMTPTTSTAAKSNNNDHGGVSESSFRLPRDVSTGTHEFTIVGYSAVQRTHDVGQSIYSGRFHVGGHDWRLRCYPSGIDTKDRGYTSIFIELQQPQPPVPDNHVVRVTTAATLKIWGDDADAGEDSPCGVMPQLSFRHDFNNYGIAYGFPKVMSVADARSSYVGPDDRLTIRCELQVSDDNPAAFGRATTTTTTGGGGARRRVADDIDMPPSNISWHLERLLERRLGFDVALLVDRQEFYAHSLILSARSPALLKEVEAAAEAAGEAAASPPVKIIEGISALVFKAVLHFIYTDALPPLHELVMDRDPSSTTSTSIVKVAGELLAAAERYQLLERLMPMCENLLCSLTTPETSAAVLVLAERHRRPELRAFCVDYMASPDVLKAVVRTEAYRELLNAGGGQLIGKIMERMLSC